MAVAVAVGVLVGVGGRETAVLVTGTAVSVGRGVSVAAGGRTVTVAETKGGVAVPVMMVAVGDGVGGLVVGDVGPIDSQPSITISHAKKRNKQTPTAKMLNCRDFDILTF